MSTIFKNVFKNGVKINDSDIIRVNGEMCLFYHCRIVLGNLFLCNIETIRAQKGRFVRLKNYLSSKKFELIKNSDEVKIIGNSKTNQSLLTDKGIDKMYAETHAEFIEKGIL